MLRIVACLMALAAPSLVFGQDVDRGRQLASRWCGNCHVAEGAKAGSADGLPSLAKIAADPATTPEMLRGFMTQTHGRMPDLSMGRRDQDDLIAYIMLLKTR